MNAGIDFQQRLGALIMVMMLTDQPDLGALGLGWDNCTVQSLNFETGDAIDDLVLVTDGPVIFIQAKRSLNLSSAIASEFSSTLRQFVGQYLRTPNADQRYLIATSLNASNRIRVDLRKLTEAARLNVSGLEVNPLTKAEAAIKLVATSLIDQHFTDLSGRSITDGERSRLWRQIHVAALDVASGGGLETLALTALEGQQVRDPRLVWGSLVALGLELATYRLSIDRAALERRMARYGPTREISREAPAPDKKATGRDSAATLPWDSPHPSAAVPRPKLMQELTAALKSDVANGVTILAGVYGAGGFGKTTLVQQLCALPETRLLYDALLWTALGEDVHGAALAARINNLIERLTGHRPGLADPQQAGFLLSQTIKETPGRLLIVVDDVWHASQLAPFLAGEAKCSWLVTTRSQSVLTDSAATVMIDRMQQTEADAVITQGVPDIPAAAITELHRVTGRWPVLLGITNRTLRRMVRYGLAPGDAADALLARLREHGPAALDVANPQARNDAVAATVDAGLDLLMPGMRDRYLELAIFAEDSEIPLDLLELYWHSTAGLGRTDVERTCLEMADLSLVSDLRLDTRTLRIHDVLRAFLAHTNGARMVTLNSQLLDAAAGILGPSDLSGSTGSESKVRPWWSLPADHGYLAEYLIEHLQAAGRYIEAHALLGDLRWTHARIAARGVSALETDLARLDSPTTRALAQAIRQNSHLFEGIQPASAFGAVLASRLADVPELQFSVAAFRTHLAGPQLVNRWPLPDRPHPAALRAVIGNSSGITDLAISPDAGWLATVDEYRTARVWDPHTGSQIASLSPSDHDSFFIDAVRSSPDGTWLVTIESRGREDGRVRVWDPSSGALRHTFSTAALAGYSESVEMTIDPDGQWLAIVDYDTEEQLKSIKMWDVATGNLRRSILDRDGWAQTIAVSSDGKWLATGDAAESNDAPCDVRLWDASTGKLRRVLAGHVGGVHRVIFGPDGDWLCSADQKGTLRISELSGELRHVLPTQMRLPDVAISPDGTWLASYDDNGPIRAWDVATGAERFTLTEHTERVILAISPDSTWFATGGDSTAGDTGVQIRDAFSGKLRDALPGHSGMLGALEISPDGAWLATADGVNLARDEGNKLVRIWAVPPNGNWVPPASQDVQNPVFDLSPDGTCVAFGASGALQVAELTTGVQRLRVHGMPDIRSVRFDPRGEWLAVSTADGVEIRSCATGELQRLLRHDEPGVKLLEVAPDGTWLVTSASPASLEDLNQQGAYSACIWDMATDEPRHVLPGHDCGVGATAIASNGAYLVTCDGNRARDRDTVVRIGARRMGGCD